MGLQVRVACTDLLQPYSDFLNLQQSLGRFAATTRQDYRLTAHRFLVAHAHVTIDRITPEHIERFLVSRRCSPRTMHSEFLRLRAFFRWARDDYRLLRADPCDRVHRPRWRPAFREAPSEAEFVALCRATQTLEELVIVEVLYHTGFRIREFLRLQIADVDLQRRLIHVVGKGARDDYAPVTVQLADLLRYWIGERIGWLLPGRQGRGRDVQAVEEILKRLGRTIGLPYAFTAHFLRHGLARTLKTSEMPIASIQQVLRHAKIQTTIDMYGRLKLLDIRVLYDKYMGGRP